MATSGKDAINGTLGDDLIDALAGDDIVAAGEGNDTIEGGIGNDTLLGGQGNDTFTDSDGSNTIYGGAGDDSITVAAAAANIIYGDGYNTFVIRGKKVVPSDLATAPLGADSINGGGGGDTIYGDNGDNLTGAAAGGNDVIHGNDGNDIIYGEGGNDQLFGDTGNDQLNGGAGADTLAGGAGADTLAGGTGNDVFIYSATADSTVAASDNISDFTQGQDKIDLTAFLGAADLKWGGAATTANGVWFAKSGGNTLVLADTNGDGVADLQVQLKGNFTLQISDFLGVAANPAPVLNSVSVNIEEGGTTSLLNGNINIVDADSVSFTYTVSEVTYGRFELVSAPGIAITSFTTAQVADGNVRFVHDGGEAAPSFSIKANDGISDSNTIAGTVNFTNVNDAPTGVATANLAAGTEDTAYTIYTSDLLQGFTDADGDTLSVTNLGATHGQLQDNGDGTWTFTPAANYNGSVNLTYDVVDGHGGSVAANQAFNIEPVNDAPVITLDTELAGVSVAAIPVGGEVRINTTTDFSQSWNAVTGLADGGYVVTWASENQDGSGHGIYAQRYAANSSAVGSEVQVNTTTIDVQFQPAITALADGGYVVTWTSYLQDGSGHGIYAQRYAADGGTVGGEAQVNTTTADYQYSPAITALADGGYVVTWHSDGQDGSGFGIYAQRYAADGSTVGGEAQVNTAISNDQQNPAITALADGGYVVTWQSYDQDGSGYGIYAQRYAADGSTVGGEVQVNTTTVSTQFEPDVAGMADGGYVVTWTSYLQDGSWSGIYAQRYAADGSIFGGEVLVNTVTAGVQTWSSVNALADGGYVVTWTSLNQEPTRNPEVLGGGIYAQRYAADGSAVGGEFLVNTTTANDQELPAVAALADGGYIVTWRSFDQDGSGYGVYAQRYAAEVKLAYIENNAPLTINPALTLVDVDSAYLSGAKVRIVANFISGQDQLLFVNQNGISGSFDAETGILTLEGLASRADYETALRMVQYLNSSEAPDTASRSLEFQVTDADGISSTPVSMVMNILPVNDIPIGTATAVLPDATAYDFHFISISDLLEGFDDADGDTLSLTNLAATNSSLLGFFGDTVYIRPFDDYYGTIHLNYDVIDGNGGSLAASQKFYVNPLNDGALVYEARVNTTTADSQEQPAITALADGGYVVTWQSNGQDGSGYGIYAQRYAADGSTVGGEVQVNTTTVGSQAYPAIAALADGGYVVTWQFDSGSGFTVYAQRYAADGSSMGDEVQVGAATASFSYSPISAVTGLTDGGYIVTWSTYLSLGIYTQRYDADGVAVGAPILIAASLREYPDITALADGGYVVTYDSYGLDGSVAGIYAQRYAADGTAVGGEERVNTYTVSDQFLSAVTGLADGGYVVTWQSNGQDGSGLGIYAQRYAADGSAVGVETLINTTTADHQHNTAITALSDGGFVVTWQSSNQDGSGYGIYAQRYAADGSTVGGEVQVNTAMANDQSTPAIAALPDGGYVVTWMSNLQDGSGWGIYAQRYDASGDPVVSALHGNGGDNHLVWTGSEAVILDGGAGNDVLLGGIGSDTMIGGAGADRFVFKESSTGGVDTVEDFEGSIAPLSGGDVLDFSDLLTGYNVGVSDPLDFVQLRESGGNTILSIDKDGTGSGHVSRDVVALQNVTGLNLSNLLNIGNIDLIA